MSGYVIRHGITEGNDKGLARGVSNIPLNSEGIAQAHAVAKHLMGKGITSLRASKLERARHFAKIISKAIDVPYELTDRLDTLDIGDLTRKPDKEIHDQITYLMTDAPDVRFPNGESMNEWLNTLWPELYYLFTLVRYEKTPTIVTHGRVTNVILALVNSGGSYLDKETLRKPPSQKPAEVYELSWDGTRFHYTPFYDPSPKKKPRRGTS